MATKFYFMYMSNFDYSSWNAATVKYLLGCCEIFLFIRIYISGFIRDYYGRNWKKNKTIKIKIRPYTK